MNAPMRKVWTQAEFFAWVAAQDDRYEFDGFAPVAMIGGSANHNQIAGNAYVALRRRLSAPCRSFFEMGVETVGAVVRFPDILVTCAPFDGETVKMPAPILVMEVISPDSARRDRIEKRQEYHAVPSILSYVIIESSRSELTVLTRNQTDWLDTSLTAGDVLRLPERGIEIPVSEFYDGVAFPPSRSAP